MLNLNTKVSTFKKVDGTAQIFIRLYIDGVKRDVNTGVYVVPGYFDNEKAHIKPQYPNAHRLNLLIEKKRQSIIEFLTTQELSNQVVTVHAFDEAMKIKTNRSNPFEFFDAEITHRNELGIINDHSAKSHRSVFAKLKAWNAKLTWHDFTPQLAEDYTKHLKKTLGNGQNTVANNLKAIKTYLKIALKRKYIQADPFADVVIRWQEVSPIFLDTDELRKVHQHYTVFESFKGKDKLYLRVFLFECLTGLRIGDIEVLEFSNIKKYREDYFIVHRATKTMRENSIHLSPLAVNLLKDQHGEKCLM